MRPVDHLTLLARKIVENASRGYLAAMAMQLNAVVRHTTGDNLFAIVAIPPPKYDAPGRKIGEMLFTGRGTKPPVDNARGIWPRDCHGRHGTTPRRRQQTG
jgi:hypothetical protein